MRLPLLAPVFLLAACASAAPVPSPASSAPASIASAAPPACVELAPRPGPLRLRVTLAPGLVTGPISGRLLVLMSSAAQKKEVLELELGAPDPALASAVVTSLAPGGSFELDPDRLAYPRPFSRLPAGSYQFMAILDPDGTFALRSARDDGDLFGPVVQATLDPAHTETLSLTLDRRTKIAEPEDAEGVTTVRFQSPLLTAFFDRPIEMRATVALPPGADPKKRYPTAYAIPGFGSSDGWLNQLGKNVRKAMTAPPWNEIAVVYLKGAVPSGHHVFADSANVGPWNRALVEELIPYLEKRFPLVAKPQARFVTGHSSGGWASLWLQVTHPEFFGGTWSSAPDPVDFRSFFTFDASPGSTDNAFHDRDGKPRGLWHDGDRELMSFEDLIRVEEVEGGRGGPLSTLEWVFSPRGPDGQPQRLFDRQTGELDPAVQRAWAKYDIHAVLESRWKELGPRLAGKLHLVVGGADSFHLDAPTKRLCDFLKEKGSDATCEIVPGKGHFDLYGRERTEAGGLFARIVQAMVDRSKQR